MPLFAFCSAPSSCFQITLCIVTNCRKNIHQNDIAFFSNLYYNWLCKRIYPSKIFLHNPLFNYLYSKYIEKQQELHVALFLLLFTFSFLNFYLSYRNSSGRVTLKSLARCLKLSGVIVCSLSGLIDSIFTRISADFSAVCMRPNVRSKSAPAANIP